MSFNRREFLRLGGATLTGACLNGICLSGCGLGGGFSKTPFAPDGSFNTEGNSLVIDLARIPELNKIGGSVQLSVKHSDSETEIKLIIFYPEGSVYKAFANVCTHRGKELEYVHHKDLLQCASGHSEFDLTGRVLEGNASKPLSSYLTNLDGNTLFVYL